MMEVDLFIEYIFWFKIVHRLPLRLRIKIMKLFYWIEERR